MIKSNTDLVRVSLMLPAELVQWISEEVSRGYASSRSEFVRVILQKALLSERVRDQKRLIGGKTVKAIEKDYLAGAISTTWLDSLTDEERAEVARIFDTLS